MTLCTSQDWHALLYKQYPLDAQAGHHLHTNLWESLPRGQVRRPSVSSTPNPLQGGTERMRARLDRLHDAKHSAGVHLAARLRHLDVDDVA